MALTLKVLGQSAPAATTATDLYTVPASTSTVISTLLICNRGATNTTFRISVRVAGAADATKQYLYYDTAIAKNDSFAATLGVSLAATDVVTVYAGNANLSFTAFGQEKS